MVGHIHGNRSAVTCHLKCDSACAHPAPNLSSERTFPEIASRQLNRRSFMMATGTLAAATAFPIFLAGCTPSQQEKSTNRNRSSPARPAGWNFSRLTPCQMALTPCFYQSATARHRSSAGVIHSSTNRRLSTPKRQAHMPSSFNSATTTTSWPSSSPIASADQRCCAAITSSPIARSCFRRLDPSPRSAKSSRPPWRRKASASSNWSARRPESRGGMSGARPKTAGSPLARRLL